MSMCDTTRNTGRLVVECVLGFICVMCYPWNHYLDSWKYISHITRPFVGSRWDSRRLVIVCESRWCTFIRDVPNSFLLQFFEGAKDMQTVWYGLLRHATIVVDPTYSDLVDRVDGRNLDVVTNAQPSNVSHYWDRTWNKVCDRTRRWHTPYMLKLYIDLFKTFPSSAGF